MKGTINNIQDLDYLKDLLNNLKLHTKDKTVIRYKYEVARITKKRTIQQNKYLWLINNMLGNYLGYTADEIHYSVLLFLRIYKKFGTDGKERKLVKKTSDMNSVELTEYIEKVKDFASMELDFFIPNADKIPISEYEKYNLY